MLSFYFDFVVHEDIQGKRGKRQWNVIRLKPQEVFFIIQLLS